MEWHSQFGFGFFCSIYWWWDSSILLHLSLVCYFELLSSIMFNSFWSTMRTKSWASMKAQLVKNPLTMQGTPIWRSAGEGIGYPLQCSWASLVAQLVKNPPAKQETWVWSLGWEDPLEAGMETHSSILTWRIPTDSGAWQATEHGVTNSQTWLSD